MALGVAVYKNIYEKKNQETHSIMFWYNAVLFSWVCHWRQRNAFIRYPNAQLIGSAFMVATQHQQHSWHFFEIVRYCFFCTTLWCIIAEYWKPILTFVQQRRTVYEAYRYMSHHHCVLFFAQSISNNMNLISWFVWKYSGEADCVFECIRCCFFTTKVTVTKNQEVSFSLWRGNAFRMLTNHSYCNYCIATD